MKEPNYVCIKGGNYCGRADNGKPTDRFISGGEKVHLDFNLGFICMNYAEPCELRPHYVDKDVQCDRFCECDIKDKGHIYLPQENILNSFRPIIHKHIATAAFETVEKMNEWLIDKPVNSIKDIKIGSKAFLVMYIDNGDDD